MSAAYSAVDVLGLARYRRWTVVRQYLWLHPEWWAMAIALAAWGAMVYVGWAPQEHYAHLHGSRSSLWRLELAHWMIMVPAMMFPLLISPLRIVAARSLWRRRDRSLVEFLLGYMTIWILLGAGMIGGLLFAEQYLFGLQSVRLTATCLVVASAALWQVTRWKRRTMIACDFTMAIAPAGWPASLGCISYGLAMGRRCIISCGPVMVAMALCPHNTLVALALTALLMAERYSSLFQYSSVPVWTAAAVAIILCAGCL